MDTAGKQLHNGTLKGNSLDYYGDDNMKILIERTTPTTQSPIGITSTAATLCQSNNITSSAQSIVSVSPVILVLFYEL